MHASTASRRWPGRAGLLALLFLASYAYFYEGGGWNQNTRFDLVRAIVEQGTTRIDAYRDNTGDMAASGGHYYADKAPGASLTAVPAVAIVRAAMSTSGVDVATDRAVERLAYVATVTASSLPAMAGALCVFLVGRRLGASDNAAACGAVVCGLGTPWWAYGTVLYGHALAGGCLTLALLGALGLNDPGSAGGQVRRGFLTGLAAGWAVVTEYPAAVPAGLIVLLALWQVHQSDRQRVTRVLAGLAAGLTLAAVVLLGYNAIVFGNPLHVAYSSEQGDYAKMHNGIFGITWPKPAIAWALLFGAYRGLIPLAPVLVVAPAGWWLLARDRRSRPTVLVAVAVGLFYYCLVAGYAYWEGGWSYGSRHLGPALPFLCLGIAPVWDRANTWLRVVVLLVACVGVGESLVAVATTAQPPANVERPMSQLLWPAFKSGDFPIAWQSILELRPPPDSMQALEQAGIPRASWNAGQVVGLRDHASLLPLLALWLLTALLWFRPGSRATSAGTDV